jgi:hypothetical protein
MYMIKEERQATTGTVTLFLSDAFDKMCGQL